MAPQKIHDITELQPIRPTRIYAEIVEQILRLINRGISPPATDCPRNGNLRNS